MAFSKIKETFDLLCLLVLHGGTSVDLYLWEKGSKQTLDQTLDQSEP